MQKLLQDPTMSVLGQQQHFVEMCVFGKDPQRFTQWLTRMAWIEYPMYRLELYGLHKTFHSKQTLTETQRVFISYICTKEPRLKPFCFLMPNSMKKP